MSGPADSEASQTRRQQLRALLLEEAVPFEVLRQRLGMRVRELDDDLRHLERSARRRGERLVVTPPECGDCGFRFEGRVEAGAKSRFSKPGRCPRCRSRRIRHAVIALQLRRG